ncbi:MAG: hypothetical protein ACRERC_12495 [Candidatus Binatia bacterium]
MDLRVDVAELVAVWVAVRVAVEVAVRVAVRVCVRVRVAVRVGVRVRVAVGTLVKPTGRVGTWVGAAQNPWVQTKEPRQSTSDSQDELGSRPTHSPCAVHRSSTVNMLKSSQGRSTTAVLTHRLDVSLQPSLVHPLKSSQPRAVCMQLKRMQKSTVQNAPSSQSLWNTQP